MKKNIEKYEKYILSTNVLDDIFLILPFSFLSSIHHCKFQFEFIVISLMKNKEFICVLQVLIFLNFQINCLYKEFVFKKFLLTPQLKKKCNFYLFLSFFPNKLLVSSYLCTTISEEINKADSLWFTVQWIGGILVQSFYIFLFQMPSPLRALSRTPKTLLAAKNSFNGVGSLFI